MKSKAKLQDSDFDIINDPFGWLTGDIGQAAQVIVQELNPLLEGLLDAHETLM